MNRNAVVTGILLLVVFVVGFGLGRMSTGVGADVIQNIRDTDDVSDVNTPTNTTPGTDTTQTTGTTIDTSNLTPSQRQMLEALGIDADSITITPEMVACAEAKLGSARIEEIKNGASPSFSEGAALIACYR